MTIPAFGPPPPTTFGKLLTYTYDAGAGTYSTGAVGPTLSPVKNATLLESVVFTAIGTGVFVRCDLLIGASQTAGVGWLGWLDHNTGLQVGVMRLATTATTRVPLSPWTVLVTGLTPGTTYQFDLAGANASAGDGISVFIGNSGAVAAASATNPFLAQVFSAT